MDFLKKLTIVCHETSHLSRKAFYNNIPLKARCNVLSLTTYYKD